MKIQYQTATLDSVLDYYATGFKPRKKAEVIKRVDSFVDTRKGIVVFRLYIDQKPK